MEKKDRIKETDKKTFEILKEATKQYENSAPIESKPIYKDVMNEETGKLDTFNHDHSDPAYHGRLFRRRQ